MKLPLIFALEIVLIVVYVWLSGVSVQYVAEFWGAYLRRSLPIHIPFVPCVALGLVCGPFAVFAALVTWVISYIL